MQTMVCDHTMSTVNLVAKDVFLVKPVLRGFAVGQSAFKQYRLSSAGQLGRSLSPRPRKINLFGPGELDATQEVVHSVF